MFKLESDDRGFLKYQPAGTSNENLLEFDEFTKVARRERNERKWGVICNYINILTQWLTYSMIKHILNVDHISHEFASK